MMPLLRDYSEEEDRAGNRGNMLFWECRMKFLFSFKGQDSNKRSSEMRAFQGTWKHSAEIQTVVERNKSDKGA